MSYAVDIPPPRVSFSISMHCDGFFENIGSLTDYLMPSLVQILTYYFLVGPEINPFTILMSQYREMGTHNLKKFFTGGLMTFPA